MAWVWLESWWGGAVVAGLALTVPGCGGDTVGAESSAGSESSPNPDDDVDDDDDDDDDVSSTGDDDDDDDDDVADTTAAGDDDDDSTGPVGATTTGGDDDDDDDDVTTTGDDGGTSTGDDDDDFETTGGELLEIDLGDAACLDLNKVSIAEAVVGEGGPLSCEELGGPGNGRPPAGYSVADDCTVDDEFDEPRLGAWAWRVRVSHDGASAEIPVCITRDVGRGAFDISFDRSPLRVETFNPAAPLSVGDADDWVLTFSVPGACPGAGCAWLYSFSSAPSPLAGDVDLTVQSVDVGDATVVLDFSLAMAGDPPPVELAGESWIASTEIDLCLTPGRDVCFDFGDPDADALAAVAIMMVPE